MNTSLRNPVLVLALPFALGACSGSDGATTRAKVTSPTGAPAPTGTTGEELDFATDSAPVPAGTEAYKCQDFPSPFDGKAVAITSSYSNMTKGSHHLFIFTMPNSQLNLAGEGFVDCPNAGLEFHDFIHASQTPEGVIYYPKDVGRYIDGSTGFRVMVHLLNNTTDDLTVNASMKLAYTDPANVKYRAASMFLNDIGVTVPPGASTTTASYAMPYDIQLIGAASHMHQRGVHFQAHAEDGTQLFETDSWEEPVPVAIDPPVTLKAGQKIIWSCSYENNTSQTMTFGESAATNEMCIFPGTFYGGDGAGIIPFVSSDPS